MSNDNSHHEITRLVPSDTNSAERLHVLPGVVTDTSVWTGPFYFIQAADTQFGMIDKFIKELDDPKWDEEMALSETLVAACNKMEPKPKFMVICGDLVDAWPGSQDRKLQVYDFKRIFSKLSPSIPLVCVCGNHDVGNIPTAYSLDEYRRDFGDDYFYFITNGVLFIVINSQFYKHRANVEEYARKHDQWLEQILSRCKEFKYSIVFQHIAWCCEQSDEADTYFNIERELRSIWLMKFKESGVNKIMCGHWHRNSSCYFHDMEIVVTSAVGGQLGKDKSGARLVRLLEDTIEHQYYGLDEIPEKVSL